MVVTGGVTPKLGKRLAELIGRNTEAAQDASGSLFGHNNPVLTQWCKRHTVAEICSELLALGVPVAGSSTLTALRGGVPVIDARRGEVFSEGGVVCPPGQLDVAGKVLVGDGALRYRELFEAAGAIVPPEVEAHRPDPLLLVEHAGPFGPAENVDPLYLRSPDARPSQA